MIINSIIEFIFSSALFINALIFIPQAIKILREKNASGVSISTFLGFLLIQFAIILHGVINHDYLLIIGYLLSMLTCGSVVLFAFIYKKHKSIAPHDTMSFEEIIDQIPAHLYWKSKDGVMLYCNKSNWKDFGLKSLSEYIGKTDYDLFSKEQADKLRTADLEVIQIGKAIIIEEEVNTADGKIALYLSHKIPLYNRENNITGILGISFDITEAKKKELERLEILENIIALMPGHVYWIDRNNVYLGCNDNQACSAGLVSRKEIVGKRNKDLPWNFNAGVLPNTLDKINQEVMNTGKEIMIEEPALLQDGTKALFLSNKAPLRNREGEIIGMVGISIDITAHRKIEQELSDTRHKLEGMTLVSASIAHETRTPLQSLDAAVGSLKKYFPIFLSAYEVADKHNLLTHKLKPSTINLLTSIMDSMQREIQLASLVVNLLQENLVLEHAVSRDENLPIEVFSITNCVNEALERYPFKMGQKERLYWRPSIDFEVRGKELLLTHILFNFIKNALHHIAVAETKIAGKKGEIFIWLEAGNPYNKLYFKDTGTGIQAHKLPYVFERFFTQTEHGAGIGLSYCKAAMEKLGGQVTCESVEGHYTLFILSFPTIMES